MWRQSMWISFRTVIEIKFIWIISCGNLELSYVAVKIKQLRKIIKSNVASVRCALVIIFLPKMFYVVLLHGTYMVAQLIDAIDPSCFIISFNFSALCSLYKSGRKRNLSRLRWFCKYNVWFVFDHVIPLHFLKYSSFQECQRKSHFPFLLDSCFLIWEFVLLF